MAQLPIIIRLRASGALRKVRRPLAEIEADIAKAKDHLSMLKRERKSVVASEQVRRQHQDPEFRVKLRAGRAALYKDPEAAARWQAKIHASCYATGWYLPTMSKEERDAYNRLRRKGVERSEAIQVATRGRPVSAPPYVSP